jgi:SAM-dependent methyltransferase
MHDLSYREMAINIGKYFKDLPDRARVVDVGSLDINGSYRALIEPRWRYLGMDLTEGKNVDLVMRSEFDPGLPENFVDAVLCGQCLEHCRDPFRLMAELVKLAKPGAPILVVAPCEGWGEHRWPYDCWRFMPDGMRVLLERAGADCVVDPYIKGYLPGTVPTGQIDGTDCWGIGRKR